MQPLSTQRIRSALACVETGQFGTRITYQQQVGSTNDLARKLANNHAPEGTLVIADEQTAGRGRLGRRWEAPPNTSLLVSIIFRPRLPPLLAYRLVMACGLAVAEACEERFGVIVEMKWPNDLQLDGKKFVGILPESAIVGDTMIWTVVGIGVNVNQIIASPNPLAGTATSLRMVTGQKHDRAALLAHVMTCLNKWYDRLEKDALIDAWRSRCITLGRRIQATIPGGNFTGLAEDIDTYGALWVVDNAGQRYRLTASEVTLRHM